MTTLEQLKRARQILAEREWCQNELGYDAQGEPISPHNNAASTHKACATAPKLCLIGACWAASPQPFSDRLIEALEITVHRHHHTSQIPADWNDQPRRTKDQVLDLLDRTITRLEQEAAQ